MRRIAYTSLMFGMMMSVASAADQLAGSEWAPKGAPERFVQFKGDGQVSGHAGCNGFFGQYEISGSTISIGPLGATKKLCAPDIMDAERDFFEVLEKASRFERINSKRELRLISENGAELMHLYQRDWD